MAITGRTVGLVLVGVVAVLLWPSFATVGWWLLAVALLVLLDLLLARARVDISRTDPPQIRLGESGTYVVTLRNVSGQRARGMVRDAWQPSAGATGERHTFDLPPGEGERFTVMLTPTRRGDRRADHCAIRIRGPLGLAARQRSVPMDLAVRCLPAFPSRRVLPSKLRQLREIEGNSAVQIRGQGTEFDSLRDYVDGDDVRSIDWRATARRQHPVVRTWRPERDRRVVIVLDTSRTSASRVLDTPRLDHSMDAALLLTALASRAGDRISIAMGDQQIRARITGVNDRAALMHETVTTMAGIEPALVEANWSRLAGVVQQLSRTRALVVLLTALEPAVVRESLLPVLPVLTAHHRVIVASVSDPGVSAMAEDRSDAKAVYDAAAAERTRQLRRATAASVQRAGATVLDEPPGVLPVALVDHYLQLKRAGLW